LIPKTLHYVWVGPNPIPTEDQARIAVWRKMLPGWNFRHWSNEDIDWSNRYLRQSASVMAWNRISDYMRMMALVQDGGVYLDTDVDLVKALDPLLSEEAFVGFQTNEPTNQMVNGAIFGAVKGHWLPTEAKKYFDDQLDGRKDVLAFSGPGLLTQLLMKRGLKDPSQDMVKLDGVAIFPTRFFYPYLWTEQYDPGVITPDTYAVHRWAESWVSRRSLAKKIRKKLTYFTSHVAPDYRVSRVRRLLKV